MPDREVGAGYQYSGYVLNIRVNPPLQICLLNIFPIEFLSSTRKVKGFILKCWVSLSLNPTYYLLRGLEDHFLEMNRFCARITMSYFYFKTIA